MNQDAGRRTAADRQQKQSRDGQKNTSSIHKDKTSDIQEGAEAGRQTDRLTTVSH